MKRGVREGRKGHGRGDLRVYYKGGGGVLIEELKRREGQEESSV